MRSKAEIERQLAHFKTGECPKHGTVENEYWIAALEWVLGDEDHRHAYTQWLQSIEAFTTPDNPSSVGLRLALERLR
jgi:hypothetical protein